MKPPASGKLKGWLADVSTGSNDFAFNRGQIIAVKHHQHAALSSTGRQISAIKPAIQPGCFVKRTIIRAIIGEPPIEHGTEKLFDSLQVFGRNFQVIDGGLSGHVGCRFRIFCTSVIVIQSTTDNNDHFFTEPALMFTQAIVCQPCGAMIDGLTEAQMGVPDPALAQQQHQAYIRALEACGLTVTVLAADEAFPDSCFVEDPALITRKGAVITRPGAASRMGETKAIREALDGLIEPLGAIESPGSLDGGDVMMVDDHFYIGLSDRTNVAGAEQLISILRSWGLDGTAVTMNKLLHLKTGVSYLDHNHLIDHPTFSGFDILAVPEQEAYAANSLWINGRVLVPSGHPETADMISAAGYKVLTVDMSEFQKLDGGLSCLSLRF